MIGPWKARFAVGAVDGSSVAGATGGGAGRTSRGGDGNGRRDRGESRRAGHGKGGLGRWLLLLDQLAH